VTMGLGEMSTLVISAYVTCMPSGRLPTTYEMSLLTPVALLVISHTARGETLIDAAATVQNALQEALVLRRSPMAAQ
jgi:hypothetical protein